MKLIRKYPYSYWAEWTEDKIISLYIGLLAKNDGKLALLKFRIRKAIQQLPPNILIQMGEKAYWSGYYKEADLMGSLALKRQPSASERKENLELLAASQVLIGDYKAALQSYDFLLRQSSGTNNAIEYLFRMGLVQYRLKDYSKAMFYFERLLALNDKSKFELPAMYWARNSYIKLDQKEKAKEISDQLLVKYPLTYYGLRTRMEMANGQVPEDFKSGSAPVVQLYFSTNESQAWKTFNLLAESGWYDAAGRELGQLPQPTSTAQKMLYAYFWMKAGQPGQGIQLFNEVIYEDERFIRWNALKRFFPFWYEGEIKKWAEANSIEPEMIAAIIRQESSFDAQAESPARAIGLMQMISLTSTSVAKDIRLKDFSFPESLMDPETNIRMGSYYFRKILKSNRENVPLTLASYNAGIGNLYKFIKSRAELADLRDQHSTDPENELWIDELPWGETRFYVQAVMRNYLIYRWLYSDLQSTSRWEVGQKAGSNGPKK
ncbi:MAG: transglycosylase SLT domain-containing protein [Bdellovibrionales bacterium]